MKRALLAGLLLVLASFPLFAHHSTTAEFDVTHRMTLAGTLTKVDWVNPHIVVFMTAKDGAWKFASKAILRWDSETAPVLPKQA